MPGRDVIQRILALSYQWRRCFGSLKGFQSRLTIRANTNILLSPNIRLNFIYTGQDVIYLSLENFPREILSLIPTDFPQTPAPVSFVVPDQSVNQTSPLTTGRVPGSLLHFSLVNTVNLYLGSGLKACLITSTPILNIRSDL